MAAQLSSSVLASGMFPLMLLPWLAVAPYFHFHQGTAIHQLPWEHFSRHSFGISAISITGHWIRHYFFMLHYPSFVFFSLASTIKSLASTVKRFHFHCFAFLLMQSDCILFTLMNLHPFSFSSYFFLL